MHFLVDAQLPPALARWLADAGHKAEHVGDCNMEGASDAEIWDYAITTGATVISKDEDFARRRSLSVDGPVIVWLRIPNTRTQALLGWFSKLFPDIVAASERGETLIEVI